MRQLLRHDLTRSLALTGERVAQARGVVERQARTVARWRAEGRDARLGEETLRTYERTLAVLEERLNLLARELERQGGRAEFPGWPGL